MYTDVDFRTCFKGHKSKRGRNNWLSNIKWKHTRQVHVPQTGLVYIYSHVQLTISTSGLKTGINETINVLILRVLPAPACRAGCEATETTGSEELKVQSCPSSPDNQRAYWMFEDLSGKAPIHTE